MFNVTGCERRRLPSRPVLHRGGVRRSRLLHGASRHLQRALISPHAIARWIQLPRRGERHHRPRARGETTTSITSPTTPMARAGSAPQVRVPAPWEQHRDARQRWVLVIVPPMSKPCGHRSTCQQHAQRRYPGGETHPWSRRRVCTACYVREIAYFDTYLEACLPCSDEGARLLAFGGAILILIVSPSGVRRPRGWAVPSRASSRGCSPSDLAATKIKTHLYQIVTQLIAPTTSSTLPRRM